MLIDHLSASICAHLILICNQRKASWKSWLSQTQVLGFIVGKYDLKIIKDYFVKNLEILEDEII